MAHPIEVHDVAIQNPKPSPPETESPVAAALEAARELVRRLSSIPDDAPEAYHRSYGITRGLAHTMVDMLEEIVDERAATSVPGSETRERRRS